MVQVDSSSGKMVSITVYGVSDAIRAIMAKGSDILTDKEASMVQAANFLQSEIQESIMGNRGEEKSVDTGNFANSIQVEKIDQKTFGVYTDVEYAQFLEYGTIHIMPRMHFRNSLYRSTGQINQIVNS